MPDDHDPRLDVDPSKLDASDLADLAFGPLPEGNYTNSQNRWPYTTPSGHTYTEPTTTAEVTRLMADVAQAHAENWDAVELPPPPTWGMLALLNRVTYEHRTEMDGVGTMKVWRDGELIFDGVTRDILMRPDHCHHVEIVAGQPSCDCALWYSVNPHTGEQVAWANEPHASDALD